MRYTRVLMRYTLGGWVAADAIEREPESPRPGARDARRKKPPVAPVDAPGDDDAEVRADPPSADAGNEPPPPSPLNDDDASPGPPLNPRLSRSSDLGLGGTIPLGAT